MKITKRMLIIIICVIVAVGVGVFYYTRHLGQDEVILVTGSHDGDAAGPDDGAGEGAVIEQSSDMIVVQIIGEVNSPGVYEVPEGSRVNDVINAAGGATDEADLSINLARTVKDGEQIVIPDVAQAAGKDAGNVQNDEEDVSAEAETGLVNINTATMDELMTLPGIGPVIARNIIRYREENGDFEDKEALMNVPRIGENVYADLADLITVE